MSELLAVGKKQIRQATTTFAYRFEYTHSTIFRLAAVNKLASKPIKANVRPRGKVGGKSPHLSPWEGSLLRCEKCPWQHLLLASALTSLGHALGFLSWKSRARLSQALQRCSWMLTRFLLICGSEILLLAASPALLPVLVLLQPFFVPCSTVLWAGAGLFSPTQTLSQPSVPPKSPCVATPPPKPISAVRCWLLTHLQLSCPPHCWRNYQFSYQRRNSKAAQRNLCTGRYEIQMINLSKIEKKEKKQPLRPPAHLHWGVSSCWLLKNW